MLKNYLKLAFRNVARQKTLSFINIFGLAVGMACCFLILMFVMHEFSYDNFHKNGDRIYRIIDENKDKLSGVASTPFILGEKLPFEFPEFEQIVRVSNREKEKIYIQQNNVWLDENNIIVADADFFRMFSFPLLSGKAETALREPHSVVLTPSLAEKYFGTQDVIGRTIDIKIEKELYPLTITGIMQPLPANSLFNTNMICSMDVLEQSCRAMKFEFFGQSFDFLQEWGANMMSTFVLLQEGKTSLLAEQKFPEFGKRHIGEAFQVNYKLQPLNEIHLHSSHLRGSENSGDLRKITLFSGIALLILLIGCINYIILATAHSTIRTKEIGVRKVIGANRLDLIKQSIGESVFIACLALPVALILVELILPVFNSFTLRTINMNLLHNWGIMAGFLVITSLVGVISGSYVAFYISRFNPVQVLYKQKSVRTGKSLLRKSLIVTQVTVFIVLIFCTLVIYRQLFYLDHKDLGFNKTNLLSMPMVGITVKNSYATLKQSLLQSPAIQQVSAGSGAPPFQVGMVTKITTDQFPDGLNMEWVTVDYDYFKTLGIKIKEGREFSEEYSTDVDEAIIINEAAAGILKFSNPVGSAIYFGDKKRQVVGVIYDFHKGSLTDKIGPAVFIPSKEQLMRLVVRTAPGMQQEALADIKTVWEQFFPDVKLDCRFVEDSLAELYKTQRSLASLMLVSTCIAVIVAVMGLFGLALFMAEQRTKEIGIRKVIGAPVGSLVLLIFKEFFLLVIFANSIAFPLAIYFMNKWLNNFAYRVDAGWWMFLVTGLLALLLTFLVTGWQALRVAARNPVETLRYE